MATDSTEDRCRGDGCANAAVVNVSSRQVGQFKPLCLPCLRASVEAGDPGEFEVALQRRSSARIEGLVAATAVLALLPITDVQIRVGLAPSGTPSAELPAQLGPSPAVPALCGVDGCVSGAIATVNPMLAVAEVVCVCGGHLVRTVTQTPNPEVRPLEPRMLPAVGTELASLDASILGIQILFQLQPRGSEPSPLEQGSARDSQVGPRGDRPFLMF